MTPEQFMIDRIRELMAGWRDGDSADHYNILRDIDEILTEANNITR